MPRGHSNAYVEQTEPYPTMPDKASVPIVGGATVHTVKDLPPLALSREEWETIGSKMNWLPNGFHCRGKPGGGAMWIEFHDREGRVEVEELTRNGIHDAMFQCSQMLEELETAKEALDAMEANEEEHVFEAVEAFGEACRRCKAPRGEHQNRPDAFEESDRLARES